MTMGLRAVIVFLVIATIIAIDVNATIISCKLCEQGVNFAKKQASKTTNAHVIKENVLTGFCDKHMAFIARRCRLLVERHGLTMVLRINEGFSDFKVCEDVKVCP